MMRRLLLSLLLGCVPAFGAVGFTNLTGGGSIAATTTYNTASITPTANNIVLITVTGRLAAGNGPVALTSVSGDGLTWTVLQALDFGAAQGTGKRLRMETWCGVGASPSTGALTITYTTNPTGVAWNVDQSSGAAATCAGAKGNVFTNNADVATATPLTVTMTSFLSGTSATYSGGSIDASGVAFNGGGGFTDLGGNNGQAPSVETEFAATHVSPATFSYGGGNVTWGIIGIEVKVPAAATSPLVSPFAIAP